MGWVSRMKASTASGKIARSRSKPSRRDGRSRSARRCASMTVSKAASECRRSLMRPSSPAAGPATTPRPGRRARALQLRPIRRSRSRSKRWRAARPADPCLLVRPPIENGIEDALPVVLEDRKVEVQHVIELARRMQRRRIGCCHPARSGAASRCGVPDRQGSTEGRDLPSACRNAGGAAAGRARRGTRRAGCGS